MRFIHGSYLLDATLRLLITYAAAAATSAAIHTLARPAPPGSRRRAAVCVPVALTLLAVPSIVLDWRVEAMAIIPVVGVFSLAAFKVLAFAVGRGPLQLARLPGYLQFAAAMNLPVIPREGAVYVVA